MKPAPDEVAKCHQPAAQLPWIQQDSDQQHNLGSVTR